MKGLKKMFIAAALAAAVQINGCRNIKPENKVEYLKMELAKEVAKQKKIDAFDDLINFSYKAKKIINGDYNTPEGFSNEPYDLWVETEKNGKGEVIAFLVNHYTGNRQIILENDILKGNGKNLEGDVESIRNKLKQTLKWFYETIDELYQE